VDFLFIATKVGKKGEIQVYPEFYVRKSRDLMVRGGSFYAIWIPERGAWSTDQDDVVQMIDAELMNYIQEHQSEFEGKKVKPLKMSVASSGSIDRWLKYVQKQLPDNYHPLDETLVFSNSPVRKTDYSSKRLPYALEECETPAWDELVGTLYSEEDRHKIEWAIGSVVNGGSKSLQKFFVFYGSAGTGKSTVLNVIQELFDGYYSVFDSKALGSSTSSFALESFKNNPLVAIQHDGDLSRIEDNTRLNSLVSHEEMVVNEKYKSEYRMKFQSLLFMGTNKPVKITDSKSGLLRRLIDISPTGNKIPVRRYRQLVEKIHFELGGIAYHCKQVYEEDPNYYEAYVPTMMMGATNDFYNFMEEQYDDYLEKNETSLNEAWKAYDQFCKDAKVLYPYSKRVFKEELKNYFYEFEDRGRMKDGAQVWNHYYEFRVDRFESGTSNKGKDEAKDTVKWLTFDSVISELDKFCAKCQAQYATVKETPKQPWDDVETFLEDLNTRRLHYVRIPMNVIVIDFDIKDENGNKSLEKNIEAASKWPKTYAELSKSGQGIHLHYIYNGDVEALSRVYEDNVEIKVFTGKSSLRRKLTYCNAEPIATINSGLPLKEVTMQNFEVIKNERVLRNMIKKNLNKEYHPYTKPSIDYICFLLQQAYESGMNYDVTDMRPAIQAFALNSSHQPKECMRIVGKMQFKSDEPALPVPYKAESDYSDEVFFDVEVFINLFVLVYKFRNKDPVKLINPSSAAIEQLVKYKLIGFNNRKYDNHILYARMMGYNNQRLYTLSQRLISNSRNAGFGEAYNLSYTDIYDFSSKKQSLKKWEIELKIHHQELGLPWDKPVDEDLWDVVADYCANDVIATEAVFDHLRGDFMAREILADLSGLTVNDTNNQHTARIIFGDEKNPQDEFIYTHLEEMFPGYEYCQFGIDKSRYKGKVVSGFSIYKGEDPGEGGRVYAEPGMYENVALLDVASEHPTSIVELNLFGDRYTARFKSLLDIRLYIKHKDYDAVKGMFDGKLAKYMESDEMADALSSALKIPINSVYGLTSAAFDNKFRDPRNVDNIVAKRGALFMIDLQFAVQEKGFTVAHIKTDSIKIPNATPEIIDFVMEFGKKYGYTFEHEATYEKMCLVNDAVYIAKYDEHGIRNKGGKHAGEWTATGKQFQVPYVFKTLFSHEKIEFEDMCETMSVTTSLYLDMNESLPDVSKYEAELKKLEKAQKKGEQVNEEDVIRLKEQIAEGHDYRFVGKVGSFCPVKPGAGGGLLMREKDGKYNAATGSKGFRWHEAEVLRANHKEDMIDRSYYASLVDDAVASISEYCDFEAFAS
jgi:hypothetical protein